MLPRRDQYRLFILCGLSPYLHRRNHIIRQGMPQLFCLHFHPIFGTPLYQPNILYQPGIGIRLIQRKIHLIIVVLKVILET